MREEREGGKKRTLLKNNIVTSFPSYSPFFFFFLKIWETVFTYTRITFSTCYSHGVYGSKLKEDDGVGFKFIVGFQPDPPPDLLVCVFFVFPQQQQSHKSFSGR